MESPQVSQDDLTDVFEMTRKLEACISDILDGNAINLSISALMSASINCIIEQCDSAEEVLLYRDLFVKFLDSSIKSIQIDR